MEAVWSITLKVFRNNMTKLLLLVPKLIYKVVGGHIQRFSTMCAGNLHHC